MSIHKRVREIDGRPFKETADLIALYWTWRLMRWVGLLPSWAPPLEGNYRAFLTHVVISAMHYRGIRKTCKPPDNSPYSYLAKREKLASSEGNRALHPESSDKVLVCTGDSITQGRCSADWVSTVAGKVHERQVEIADGGNEQTPTTISTVNNAQNNIMTYTINHERMEWTIQCQPDYVVLMAGTNDVRCLLGRAWHCFSRLLWGVRERVTLETTEKNYRGCLLQLLERNAGEGGSHRPLSIAVCTIPPIGEDLDSWYNDEVGEFNSMVKRVVASMQKHIMESGSEDSITLLDVNKSLRSKILEEREKRGMYASKGSWIWFLYWHMYWQGLIKQSTGISWTVLSSLAGNVVLNDGLHLNEVGGNIMADMVAEWLASKEEQS